MGRLKNQLIFRDHLTFVDLVCYLFSLMDGEKYFVVCRIVDKHISESFYQPIFLRFVLITCFAHICFLCLYTCYNRHTEAIKIERQVCYFVAVS